MDGSERNQPTSQPADTELIELISDTIGRDSRRYPSRFNTENE